MKKKIILIIPYFGKLPTWFQTFLLSAGKTTIVDFLLITDDKEDFKYPENFTVLYKEFREIQNLFQQKLGKLYLRHPYKLCDYKSCYGFVFQDYISNYSYWGHSDIDIIYGNIDKFLNNINYQQYDKIFNLGHLTIYKNELRINNIFQYKLKDKSLPKICDFDFVKQTTYPCHFDELGINFISKESGLKVFDAKLCKNVNMNFYNYAVDGGRPKEPELLMYNQGELIRRRGNTEEEFMYLHIQKRKITKNIYPETEKFLITRDGFIDVREKNIDSYFKIYGLNADDVHQNQYKNELILKLKKEKTNKLVREASAYPFRFISNLWQRKIAIDFLKKNNLF